MRTARLLGSVNARDHKQFIILKTYQSSLQSVLSRQYKYRILLKQIRDLYRTSMFSEAAGIDLNIFP